MRGRIRTVKPEALKDEELWDLEIATGLPLYRGYQGLWMHSDREGRFEWRPRPLKSDILPYWEGDFTAVLDALVSGGFIIKYVVEGREYGLVPTLPKHQRFDHREPPSELPAPPADLAPPCPSTPDQVEPPPASSPGHAPTLPGHAQESPGHARVEGKGRERNGKGMGEGDRARGDGPPSSSRARTRTMPSEDPPPEYLDEAVMAGVSREQAASTWAHYFGAGLPERGVERLHPWLVQRAKERAAALTKTRARSGKAPPRSRNADAIDYALGLATGGGDP